MLRVESPDEHSYDEYASGQRQSLPLPIYRQAWLPEIGLYSYKARPYSPTLGRFMQTDPIGCADGTGTIMCMAIRSIVGIIGTRTVRPILRIRPDMAETSR